MNTTVRADKPSIDLFALQNPTSLLNANASKMVCNTDTSVVTAKSAGFPSNKTRFISSPSPSRAAPKARCLANVLSICSMTCQRHRPSGATVSVRFTTRERRASSGTSASRSNQKSFMYTVG